jgi:hypothetical protein
VGNLRRVGSLFGDKPDFPQGKTLKSRPVDSFGGLQAKDKRGGGWKQHPRREEGEP